MAIENSGWNSWNPQHGSWEPLIWFILFTWAGKCLHVSIDSFCPCQSLAGSAKHSIKVPVCLPACQHTLKMAALRSKSHLKWCSTIVRLKYTPLHFKPRTSVWKTSVWGLVYHSHQPTLPKCHSTMCINHTAPCKGLVLGKKLHSYAHQDTTNEVSCYAHSASWSSGQPSSRRHIESPRIKKTKDGLWSSPTRGDGVS